MPDSLDDLEREAAERQRRSGGGRGGRKAGEPRFPRKPNADDEATRRREELARREEERQRRQREAEAAAAAEAEAATPPPPESPADEGAGEGNVRKKRVRPSSMPFYPNPEHETFLWRVTEAASARQKRIPATAVLRLALTRLEQQMTPSEIVQALGGVEQPEGKMGRPRL